MKDFKNVLTMTEVWAKNLKELVGQFTKIGTSNIGQKIILKVAIIIYLPKMIRFYIRLEIISKRDLSFLKQF